MSIILVAGALANKPQNGGEAWVRLSWVRGLQRLGFTVHLVEQIRRATCVDAVGAPVSFAESVNRSYFAETTARFGLTAALVCADDDQVHGMTYAELSDLADAADLLVNISGHLDRPDLLRRIPRKAYVDIDPGFTQFWHAAGNDGARLGGHDVYFTIAENIGDPSCAIPTAGIPWRTTRQPVVLDDWPYGAPGAFSRFTTVASWRGPFGPVVHDGRTFGLKVHEFRKVVDLPRRAGLDFEIALNIHPADEKDRCELLKGGWRLEDPLAVAADPLAFRRYVQGSGAEFSVAQGIYVDTNSGWFSDRSVRYLASGRPVLVQDTGFSRTLPAGQGLLAFRTPDEAAEGARRLVRDYEAHGRAARALAESHFDADVVLPRFLDEAGL